MPALSKLKTSKDILLGVLGVVVILIIVIVAMLTAKTYTFPENITLATWMWEIPTEIDQTLDELRKEGIDTVYLNVAYYIGIYEMPEGANKTDAYYKYADRLADFINRANQRGMQVEALAGNPKWSNSSHRYLLRELMEFVVAFNNEYAVQFSGLQFNLEPYLQENFSEKNNEILREYLDTLQGLAIAYTELGLTLRFGVTLPFWFDDQRLRRGDKFQSIAEHVLDIYSQVPDSYVAILSYRNTTRGLDGSIYLAEQEVRMAADRGVDVVIGQETLEISPEKITFFAHSRQAVKQAATEITRAFQPFATFKGIALHDAQGYLNLGD